MFFIVGCGRNTQTDEFSGTWKDENDIPNIAYVGNAATEKITPESSRGGIYKYFQHSFQELEELHTKISLSELFTRNLILSNFVDVSQDQLILEYSTKDDLSTICTLLQKLNKKDIKIVFKESNGMAENLPG